MHEEVIIGLGSISPFNTLDVGPCLSMLQTPSGSSLRSGSSKRAG